MSIGPQFVSFGDVRDWVREQSSQVRKQQRRAARISQLIEKIEMEEIELQQQKGRLMRHHEVLEQKVELHRHVLAEVGVSEVYSDDDSVDSTATRIYASDDPDGPSADAPDGAHADRPGKRQRVAPTSNPLSTFRSSANMGHQYVAVVAMEIVIGPR